MNDNPKCKEKFTKEWTQLLVTTSIRYTSNNSYQIYYEKWRWRNERIVVHL